MACAQGQWTSLSGEWRFALDPKDIGLAQDWQRRTLEDTIRLPGTTDEARKGPLNTASETARLTRLYPYIGAAWYQRNLEVPESWVGRRIVLELERTKKSRVWIGDRYVGAQDSLTTAHRYTLSPLAAGTHRLTIRISNHDLPPLGDASQITEHTQTNWNGIVGRIGVMLTDVVWIDSVRVEGSAARRTMKVQAGLGNLTGETATGRLQIDNVPVEFEMAGASMTVEKEIPLPAATGVWDEFRPALHRIMVTLEAATGTRRHLGRQALTTGVRDFESRDGRLWINGRTVFLRGRTDTCVFPITGYAPMDEESWRRVFRVAKEYGLNHVRFHSWCPPEAAFRAADELGIYLQPELPNWMAFGRPEHGEYLKAEGERILRAYGHHPSFVMFTLGNEMGGRQETMQALVDHFRKLDGRRLYAQGSNNWFPQPGATDDFWVTFRAGKASVRGSFATVNMPLGHIQTGPANTLRDYREAITGARVPVVSHEIGEYQVAPVLDEIPEYTGVLRARNFEVFRERMAEAGLLRQSEEFVEASGALAVRCYREEIEAALRTPGFGGFQLLDLMDFPGQGTALVGILDAFMNPKGLIPAERWREFCSATVPLARLPKYVWTQGETFTAEAELAHYGPETLAVAKPAWTLKTADGATVAEGRLPETAAPAGGLARLGTVKAALAAVKAPARVRLELRLDGTPWKNGYDIWVYPDRAEAEPGSVVVARVFDEAARGALAKGLRVLLLPEPGKLTGGVPGMFTPDFWNYGMFRQAAERGKHPVSPGTLGLLIDASHEAFAQFPTDTHADWQWFDLAQNSRSLRLTGAAAAVRPLVQVIDNYERAWKLAMIWEVRVGPGRLLVCTADLPALKARPEAGQLLASLLAYMNSGEFAPEVTLDEAQVAAILN